MNEKQAYTVILTGYALNHITGEMVSMEVRFLVTENEDNTDPVMDYIKKNRVFLMEKFDIIDSVGVRGLTPCYDEKPSWYDAEEFGLNF